MYTGIAHSNIQSECYVQSWTLAGISVYNTQTSVRRLDVSFSESASLESKSAHRVVMHCNSSSFILSLCWLSLNDFSLSSANNLSENVSERGFLYTCTHVDNFHRNIKGTNLLQAKKKIVTFLQSWIWQSGRFNIQHKTNFPRQLSAKPQDKQVL